MAIIVTLEIEEFRLQIGRGLERRLMVDTSNSARAISTGRRGSSWSDAERLQHQLSKYAAPARTQEQPRQRPDSRWRTKAGIEFSATVQNARQRFARLLTEIIEHRRLVNARDGAERGTTFRLCSLAF